MVNWHENHNNYDLNGHHSNKAVTGSNKAVTGSNMATLLTNVSDNGYVAHRSLDRSHTINSRGCSRGLTREGVQED